MLFFIRYNEKEYRVRVESRRGQIFVQYGDEPESVVDLHYYGNDCSFISNNRVFSANVTGQKHDYTVWSPSGDLHMTVESEYRRIVGLLRGQDTADESNLYAKMPGKIVKILVKAKERVEKGKPVMVMEAMKKENEIRATKTGEISTLHVKEGQNVETGALLAEMANLEDEE